MAAGDYRGLPRKIDTFEHFQCRGGWAEAGMQRYLLGSHVDLEREVEFLCQS